MCRFLPGIRAGSAGPFDFLLDYGVLDDLRLPQRELYKRSILPLTHHGSRFLLWGFHMDASAINMDLSALSDEGSR